MLTVNPALPGNVENLLSQYRDLVAKANQRLNLVSRRDVNKVISGLVADSLLPLNWNGCRIASPVLDIGSGAGIPGIPLRIAKPDLCVILVESNRRKALFLKQVVELLRLEGVEVVNDRVEHLAGDVIYAGHFQTVVSRAAATLRELLAWSEPLLKPEGELIAWKGSAVDEELRSLDSNGWRKPNLLRRPGGLTLVRFVKV